ncbi:MAG: BON domain-containing protein [Pirellulaceae bacterium]
MSPLVESIEEIEAQRKEQRIIRNVRTMLKVHHRLRNEASDVRVSIKDNVVILRGSVATWEVKRMLVPAIRQAGVLWSVSNHVRANDDTSRGQK